MFPALRLNAMRRRARSKLNGPPSANYGRTKRGNLNLDSCKAATGSGHDDFVAEAARRDDKKKRAHDDQSHGVGPQVAKSRTAENDAARDVNEICGRNQVADRVEQGGNGFAREDVAGEKHARKNGEKSELHGFGLRIRLAGDENTERESGEQIRQRQSGEQHNVAVNGNEEHKAHEKEDEAKFEKADAEIGQQFSEKKAERFHGRDKELFECAALFFADDGKGGEKGGDVEKHDGGEAGKEEIGRTRIGIEEQLGAHVHGEGSAVGEDAVERFVEADGVGDVDGLSCDGGVRAVNENENLRAHVVEQAIGIVHGYFDAHARFARDNHVVEVVIVFDVADDVKCVGVFQAVEQLAAFATVVGVVDDGVDLPDVGVNGEAEQEHLQERHREGEKERARVAAHVQRFLIKDGAETAEKVTHGRPPARIDDCMSIERRRPRGLRRADGFP